MLDLGSVKKTHDVPVFNLADDPFDPCRTVTMDFGVNIDIKPIAHTTVNFGFTRKIIV